MLKDHHSALCWIISNIKGISPFIVMHQIQLEEGAKPSRKPSVHFHDAVELLDPRDGSTFQVNEHGLKEYLEFVDLENVAEEIPLVDPG